VAPLTAQQTHGITVLGPWLGLQTLVVPVSGSAPPVVVTDAAGIVCGRALAGGAADAVSGSVAGFAWINNSGCAPSVENSYSVASGSSGSYTYLGSNQGAVTTAGNSTAGVLGQIWDPVDAFASAFAFYSNSCAGSFSAHAVVNHVVNGNIPPYATAPVRFSANCETNQFSFNSSNGGVVLVRAYEPGGIVFVRAFAAVTSSTILFEM